MEGPMKEIEWERVPNFRDLAVGQPAKLIRRETNIGPDFEGEPDVIVPYAEYEGIVEELNWRGQVWLGGHERSFLEDGVFGDWFYEVYKGKAE